MAPPTGCAASRGSGSILTLFKDGHLHTLSVARRSADEASEPATGDDDSERILLCHCPPTGHAVGRPPPRLTVFLAHKHAAQLTSIRSSLLESGADALRALVTLGLSFGRRILRQDCLHEVRHVHLVARCPIALRQPRELRQVSLELAQQLRRPIRLGLLANDHRGRRGRPPHMPRRRLAHARSKGQSDDPDKQHRDDVCPPPNEIAS